MHRNRTCLGCSSHPTSVLKTGGRTSAPGISTHIVIQSHHEGQGEWGSRAGPSTVKAVEASQAWEEGRFPELACFSDAGCLQRVSMPIEIQGARVVKAKRASTCADPLNADESSTPNASRCGSSLILYSSLSFFLSDFLDLDLSLFFFDFLSFFLSDFLSLFSLGTTMPQTWAQPVSLKRL